MNIKTSAFAIRTRARLFGTRFLRSNRTSAAPVRIGKRLAANFILGFALCLGSLASATTASAQYCNPAAINYIVRDERGAILGENELKSIFDQMPKLASGVGSILIEPASLTPDHKSFYTPESINFDKGEKMPSLLFVNSATCKLRFAETTLTYHSKKMRLIFNLDIPSDKQPLNRLVIDSLPFREGSFKLNLNGVFTTDGKVVPAQKWEKEP